MTENTTKGWIEDPLYSKILENVPIPCVDLLVMYKKKLLLVKRNNSPAKNLWFTPGERVLKGEYLEETVKRVLKTETGLEPKNIEQKGTMCHIWKNVHTVSTYFLVTVRNQDVKLDEQHQKFRWVTKMQKTFHPYIIEMVHKSNLFFVEYFE